MNLTVKFSVIAGLLLGSLVITGCPRKQPVTEIGFSCNRLNSCYLNYGNQLQDIQVRKIVEDAQKSKDETQCLNAIEQFSAAVKQECPF